MNGINGVGATNPAQNQSDSPSRRPGTPGHPGKHLGQLKRAQKQPDSANLPLVQQQLSSLGSLDSGKGKGATKTNVQQPAQQEELNQQIAAEALRSTRESISDQIKFTSRFNAIGTAFF